ncbi:hypothetical protein ACFSUD_09530 [Sulfitobacter aestuarii]|uniref:MarR family transcriptional regulator n=1 Tax=Sulfitobacter aestuarii TaxID=2161676 RepID=A0ABW5U381_9RHOB
MTDWAVFTGDIVKSSELGSEQLSRIFSSLEEAADEVARWQDAPTLFTRFRGDGWQMAVAPALTFRALLAMRAAVRRVGKGLDSRIGIGIGQGRIPGDDLSGAEGVAFLHSGHALDEMKRTLRMSAPEADLSLRLLLPLADQIIDGWTARQAEIAYLLLPPEAPTQSEVADRLGQTRQSVQQQADQSGIMALLESCTLLENPAKGETGGYEN